MGKELIREIEDIIDIYHKGHSAFLGTKEQLIYRFLRTYGNSCVEVVKGVFLNPLAIDDLMKKTDALNQVFLWIANTEIPIGVDVNIELMNYDEYENCKSFMDKYAYSYSVISSGYISYSRKRMTANIENSVVTFDCVDNTDSIINDMLKNQNNLKVAFFMMKTFHSLLDYSNEIRNRTSIDNNQLCIEFEKDDLESFIENAKKQWDLKNELPNDWVFEDFTLEEYRQVWIAIYALCCVYFSALLNIDDEIVRINNSILKKKTEDLVSFIASVNGIEKNTIKRIIDYVTYDSSIKNNDIIYQPIVQIDREWILIAPMLFIAANPERNLLSIVNLKNNDKKHSKETNMLETLMADEIVNLLPKTEDIVIKKHKLLDGNLPDIDLAILDVTNNAVLLCELKWAMDADSVKEIYAREDYVTTGCKQQEQIMGEALKNRRDFVKRVFELDNMDNIDIFCCVVTKHNTRTRNRYVPVIDVDTFKDLLSSQSLINVFLTIRNRNFECKPSGNMCVDYEEIEYAGYIFRIPALCIDSEEELLEDAEINETINILDHFT